MFIFLSLRDLNNVNDLIEMLRLNLTKRKEKNLFKEFE